MLGSLTLVMNSERALIAQMLLAVLTKLSRIVLFTLLANYLAINCVLLKDAGFPCCMRRYKVFLKAWLAINDLATGALNVNDIDLTVLRVLC
jgi:hypothetical protein